MSTGGIFQLITNDGKQDKLLMATQLLNRRLSAVRRARAAAGLDPTPTLADIEKTHVLFVNAHFKPFTAIASEYSKVRASGNYNLGQTVQFSIPQFGDFFADMVMKISLDISECMDYTQASTGLTADSPSEDYAKMRFCPWLGERIFEKVSFTVNGNPLDEYTPNAVNIWREFYVQENKKKAYANCMGQEQEESAEILNEYGESGGMFELSTARQVFKYVNGLQTPKHVHGVNNQNIELWVPLLFWFNKDLRLAIPSVAIPYGQRYINITLQKPRKILSKFSGGRYAVNLDSVKESGRANSDYDNWTGPLGGVFTPENTKVDMELYINNLFVNPEIHEVFIKRVGFNLIRVHREQTFVCEKDSNELLLNNMKWPIETLYVGMRPVEYKGDNNANAARYNDRWHCYTHKEREVVYNGNGASVVTKVVGSFTAITAGTSTNVVPTFNLDSSDVLRYGTCYEVSYYGTDNKWYNGTLTMPDNGNTAEPNAYIPSANPTTPASAIGDFTKCSSKKLFFRGVQTKSGALASSGININYQRNSANQKTTNGDNSHLTLMRQVAYGYNSKKTLDSVRISAHGIPIFDNFEADFFSKYTPYQYGGPNLKAPDDEGLLMLNFCLYPGSYQPSGHINVSRAREFYLKYSSSVVGTDEKQGELVVMACAINFLLISDGSAVLRYST